MMLWIGETLEAVGEFMGHMFLVDGKPAPLVVLEEVNGFLKTVLTVPASPEPK